MGKMLIKVLSLCLMAIVVSCSTSKDRPKVDAKKTAKLKSAKVKQKHSLTKKAMLTRTKAVTDVSYILSLDLSKKKETYKGSVEIHFTQKLVEDDLRVDFFNGTIDDLFVNGKKIKTINHNGVFLLIDESDLKVGSSIVKINFTQTYSKSGEGFYRFVDPVDQKIYVYTDFEPYNANYLFPCFDQPNLKATYKLDVLAPKNWQVITSVYEAKVDDFIGAKKWDFPVSQKFSTYIFNVTAGPYKRWSDTFKGKRKIVPLRLYARQSLSKHVGYKEWFKLTKDGMTFMGEYFGVDYPFDKYDQMLVPDFNWGGMENVGAVTYNEGHVYKSKPTKSQRERRANVIMHELAHMWFGNLVTMDWWNGLWLNESFATVMANITLEQATEFTDVWETFFNRTKGWAYWQDQLVTTHPIEVKVDDTDTAFTNFDGITYGKGASVLKQLIYFLGDDFKKGIQHYFKMHAYQNTELSDFFNSMEYASKKDLSSWVQSWLYTAQVNTIEPILTCSDGKLDSLSIKQTAPKKYPTLREHKSLIGFYKLKGKNLVKYKELPITYKGASTNIEVRGIACPDLVYPNLNDFDYVKVKLDKRSLETAKKNITKLPDSMTRSMVWKSMWNMVRSAEWKLTEYIDLALDNIRLEKNRNIRQSLLRNLYRSSSYYLGHMADQGVAQAYISKLEDFAWVRLRAAKVGSDSQKEWFKTFVYSVRSKAGVKRLQSILAKKTVFPGLIIDQDKRWWLVEVLNRNDLKEGRELIDAELKVDKSSRGSLSAIAARTLVPNLENKTKWFNEIVNVDSKRKLSELTTMMDNLFPRGQTRFISKFKDEWKKNIVELAKSKENHFLSSFAYRLAPALCDQASINDLALFIKEQKTLPTAVLKELKVVNQENERCYNIVKLLN